MKKIKKYKNIDDLNFSINVEKSKGKYNLIFNKTGLWREVIDENKLLYQLKGRYKNGKKIGKWKESISGNYQNENYLGYVLKRSGEYIDGYKQGLWKYFFVLGGFSNWKQYGLGNFDKGIKVGIWKRRNDPESKDEPNKLFEKIDYTSGEISPIREIQMFEEIEWDDDKIWTR